ncbi:hypothetical protein BDN67DRAFT_975214 [Paxillus ammoniavirescens]|nr:hypothetical protein BDN67DRAFT_975214 [Paxillus ammoniavirescens]
MAPAITSLSAYTLMGVHAKCPICPTSVDGMELRNQCTVEGLTACQYQVIISNGLPGAAIYCYYDGHGRLNKDSDVCPQTVQTIKKACPPCTYSSLP